MGVGEGRIQRTNIERTCPEHVTYSLSLSHCLAACLCVSTHTKNSFLLSQYPSNKSSKNK